MTAPRDTTSRLAVTSRKEGEVLVRKRKRGRVYALRFQAYGSDATSRSATRAKAGPGAGPTRS